MPVFLKPTCTRLPSLPQKSAMCATLRGLDSLRPAASLSSEATLRTPMYAALF